MISHIVINLGNAFWSHFSFWVLTAVQSCLEHSLLQMLLLLHLPSPPSYDHIHYLVSVNIQQVLVNVNEWNFFPPGILQWYISTLYSFSCQMPFCQTATCNKAKKWQFIVQPLLQYHRHSNVRGITSCTSHLRQAPVSLLVHVNSKRYTLCIIT